MRHGFILAALAVAVGAGLPAPAPADAIDDALEILNQRNIAFTVEEFVDVVTRNDYENVRVFLQAGMDPNTPNLGQPMLLWLSMRGYIDTVKAMLEGGAAVKVQDEHGWTPLHMAVFFSHIDVAEALLERGAAVSPQTDYGMTPLHFATQERNVEVAALLLRKGASPTAKSKSGVTPLSIAVDLNEKPMVKLYESLGYGPRMKAIREAYAAEKEKAVREDAARSAEADKRFKEHMKAATGGRGAAEGE